MAAHQADAALHWGWLTTTLTQQPGTSLAYDVRSLFELQSYLNPPCLACASPQSCCECRPAYPSVCWEAGGSPTSTPSSLPVTATPWWYGGLGPAGQESVGDGTLPRAEADATVKSFQCPVCRKEFSSKARLRQHERAHSGELPYTCTECHKRFLRKGDFTVHMRIHTDERPFGCPECPKRFRNSANRRCHLRTHTGERPYGCSECPRRFSESGHLKRHLRTHTGEKPHACPVCPRRFGQKGNLRTHLLNHTGEKPHACPVCPRRFGQKGNLRTHLLNHTGEKPFPCTECPRRFNKSISLRAHLLKHPAGSQGQPSAFSAIPASAACARAQCGGYGTPLSGTSASLTSLGVEARHVWAATLTNYFERRVPVGSASSPAALCYVR